jgi:hypothetical protein
LRRLEIFVLLLLLDNPVIHLLHDMLQYRAAVMREGEFRLDNSYLGITVIEMYEKFEELRHQRAWNHSK